MIKTKRERERENYERGELKSTKEAYMYLQLRRNKIPELLISVNSLVCFIRDFR
jgi:hypothetical protein